MRFLKFVLFFLVSSIIHFFFWEYPKELFIKFYSFLLLIFTIVMVLVDQTNKYYKEYIGFVFLGIVLVKLLLIKLYINHLNVVNLPNYKLNFIIPYLISLVLIVIFSVSIINKKNIKKTDE